MRRPDGELEALVRRRLGLPAEAPVSLVPVERHSNINHVYQVTAAGRPLYLKRIPESPKHLPVSLPPSRVEAEARALELFGELAGDQVVIPEVLFVDLEHHVLAMSDVGAGREVLADRIDEKPDLLAEQARRLGRALARLHGGTRGMEPLRPPAERRAVQAVIFDGLLAPGVKVVEPGAWPELAASWQEHASCLVHADLWSKNLLVRRGEPVALVDFEGAILGDPALDLGTLVAVALLPALVRRDHEGAATRFVEGLTGAYVDAADGPWAHRAVHRSLRATGVFLAARGFGPFAYDLPEESRERIGELAGSLLRRQPAEVGELVSRAFPAPHPAAGGRP